MDPQDPTNPFPSEYAHLHELVTAAETQLQVLNREMSQAGVGPKLTPPNMQGMSFAPQVRRSRVDIQRDKDNTKANAYEAIEKETDAAAPDVRDMTRDIAFGRLYREEIQQIQAERRGLASPAVSWTLDAMQVRALIFVKEGRDRHQARQLARAEPVAEERETPSAPQQPRTPGWEPER